MTSPDSSSASNSAAGTGAATAPTAPIKICYFYLYYIQAYKNLNFFK